MNHKTCTDKEAFLVLVKSFNLKAGRLYEKSFVDPKCISLITLPSLTQGAEHGQKSYLYSCIKGSPGLRSSALAPIP